jgi:pimeloyl-ACP methyl ester carboxylesterase
MPRRIRPVLLVCLGRIGLVLAFVSVQPGSARDAGLVFEPCTLAAPGLPVTISAGCATLEVVLDRKRPAGPRIRLAIARVPSVAKRSRPDPVVMLAGGPGQSALESFPAVATAFRDALRTRDVILVDQRGTGGSHPLHCDAPGAAIGSVPSTEAEWRRAGNECLRQLDIDPRHFTTGDAVADLDAVRTALGAAQLNLVGISYGTRVAIEYARRHPDRTRALVLDGVVPPTLALGADHGRNLEEALDRIFAMCTGNPGCARRFGSPRETLETLLAKLEQAPPAVTYRDPWTDLERTEPLTADRVAGVIRLYAYVPALAAMLPYALAQATAGRPERLMAQTSMIESLVGEQIDLGLQLAVTCSEDAPALERDARPGPTLLGEDFAAALVAQCSDWPRGRIAPDFHARFVSTVPALLLSGELDPVTPPRYGEDVVAGLVNGVHLVARGQGHNVMTAGCIPRLIGQFLRDLEPATLDVTCVEQLRSVAPFAGPYGWEP